MNNHMNHAKGVTLKDIKSLLALTLIMLALALSACSQKSSQNEVSVSGDTLSAPLPSALLAVDETNLVVGVVVDSGSPKTCADLSVNQGMGRIHAMSPYQVVHILFRWSFQLLTRIMEQCRSQPPQVLMSMLFLDKQRQLILVQYPSIMNMIVMVMEFATWMNSMKEVILAHQVIM